MPAIALLEIDCQGWILATGHREITTELIELRSRVRALGGLVVVTRYQGRVPADVRRFANDTDFVPGLEPTKDDLLFTKVTRDITDNPDLVDTLRLRGICELIVSGALTEHGVSLAAGSLAALGFGVHIAAAACSGISAAHHDGALATLHSAGIDVDAARWLDAQPD